MNEDTEIVIVGGGMAGLSAATRLAELGLGVIVIDKGRGPGGRMAARRIEIGGDTVTFDHGAQYFTAREPSFRKAVNAWEAAGAAARWPAAGDDAWVGTPAMNACIKAMAQQLDVRWGMRAERLVRGPGGWRVEADGQTYTARTVLIAVPAEQAAVLLSNVAPDLAALAQSVQSAPCWAVMAAFHTPLSFAPDTFRSDTGPVSWAARNCAKPERSGPETWVIHASASRSRTIIDLAKEDAAQTVLADFHAATGTAHAETLHLDAHRWLYALPQARRCEGAYFDTKVQVGMAGDYLHSPRVEGAWLSGRVLAEIVCQERVARMS